MDNTNALVLKKEDFTPIDGQFFMTAKELGSKLGFKDPFRGVKKIYLRHKEEITPFKGLSQVGTPGGEQEHLTFSEIGCYIIAMLAQTEKAKLFRRALAEFIRSVRTGDVQLVARVDKLEQQLIESSGKCEEISRKYDRLSISFALSNRDRLSRLRKSNMSKHQYSNIVRMSVLGYPASMISEMLNVPQHIITQVRQNDDIMRGVIK